VQLPPILVQPNCCKTDDVHEKSQQLAASLQVFCFPRCDLLPNLQVLRITITYTGSLEGKGMSTCPTVKDE